MELIVTPAGQVKAIYAESLDLHALGRPIIVRASAVEPTETGHWTADLSPVGGPMLGPFQQRSQAVEAELAWLQAHWMMTTG